MFSVMTSRKRCCAPIPFELIASDWKYCLTGRGVIGNGPTGGLGILADRGPKPVVCFFEELGIRLETDLGIGERRHLARQVLFDRLLLGDLRLERAVERRGRAGVHGSRDPLRDASLRRGGFLQPATKGSRKRAISKQSSDHRFT